MISVKGRFQDGVVRPLSHLQAKEGQIVLIILPDNDLSLVTEPTDQQYEALESLLEECRVHTGIADLAHQHDHYLHGTQKR